MKEKIYKKIIWLALLFLQTTNSYAQYDQDLTEKYWFYRHRLHTEFMKRGLGECSIASGYSIPAVENYKQEDSNALHFGDGTSYIGIYMAVLATEHLLLSNNGASGAQLEKIRQDLYYAMKAYERLDKNAEILLKPHQANCDSPINGFFIRDDVDKDIYLNDFPTPKDPSGAVKNIISDYSAAKNTDECAKEPLRFPTIDQMTNLLTGFAVVIKCMDQHSYNGYNFKIFAKAYTDKLLSYMKDVNYIIKHPNANCEVQYAADGGLIAYGMAHAGQTIKEERFGTQSMVRIGPASNNDTDYESDYTFLSSAVWMNTLNYPSGKRFFEENFNTTDGEQTQTGKIIKSLIGAGVGNGIYSLADAHDYNNAIVSQLAAIGNLWKIGMVPQNRTLKISLGERPCGWGHWDDCCDKVFGINWACRGCQRFDMCEYSIDIPYTCYDGNLPTQLHAFLNEWMAAAHIPFSNLSSQFGSSLPVKCVPGYNMLPEISINSTSLALSEYGDLSEIQVFPALHQFLHNKGDYSYNRNFFRALLKDAPCSGPHYKPFRDPYTPPVGNDWTKKSEDEGSPSWRQDSRWEKCSRHHNATEGAWNGLDYMFAYNIYRLTGGGNLGAFIDQLNFEIKNKTYPDFSNPNHVKGNNPLPIKAQGYEFVTADKLQVNANTSSSTQIGNVTLRAGKAITITNTEVVAGANFIAYIDTFFPCSTGSSNLRSGEEDIADTTTFVEANADDIEVKYYKQISDILEAKMDSVYATIQQPSQYIPVEVYVAQQPNVTESVNLSPNPFDNQIQVSISNFHSSQVDMVIYNSFGEPIIQRHVTTDINATSFNYVIPTIELNAGVYHCKVSTINGTTSIQIIK